MTRGHRFECPLCHSRLSEAQYLRAVGVWQEQERFRARLKERLQAAAKARDEAKALKTRLGRDFARKLAAVRMAMKREAEQKIGRLTKVMGHRIRASEQREAQAFIERRRLLAALERLRKETRYAERRGEQRASRATRNLIKQLQARVAHSEAMGRRAAQEKSQLQRQFRHEIRRVERSAAERGKAEIKRANERVLRTVHAKDTQIERLNGQIKQLHEQIRRGVTQQMEGLNFEKILLGELRGRFKDDNIQPFGKGGDILHSVIIAGRKVGAVLYECKKTDKWSNNFLKQVKRDMAARDADYGVVVTFALPKTARGFLVRSGVSFVHPYGALHLADTLRCAIVEVHRTNLSPGKINEKLKDLMEYIRGNRFRGSIRQVIGETEELVNAMAKEMQEHKRFWKDRYTRYGAIFDVASRMRLETVEILSGKDTTRIDGRANAFVPMPTLTYEK